MYKTKFRADEEVQKYHARLVAKGHAQQYGLDYEEVFSPVARLETVRIILVIAAQARYLVYHFDVHYAFLNGNISKEAYVG